MTIRERYEESEKNLLSKFATLSSRSKGRHRQEEKCIVRTDFQRDRDRIIHSKAFRRLMHKTQVFISPEGDHYRTRLTHTLEVSQIARTIARGLKLNEDLTEAIALGHDLGHTPFGHTGEEILDSLMEEGFRHEEQSLRVVDILEQGVGLNLTWEVRDGIRHHTSSGTPGTLEGKVVQISDRIAYINHDIDDALRSGILRLKDLPQGSIKLLGESHSRRIDTMIKDIIAESYETGNVGMSSSVYRATKDLRDFMFEKVYIGSRAKEEEEKAQEMLRLLFEYYCDHPETLPREFVDRVGPKAIKRAVCDYIAGMTDSFAIRRFKDYFMPNSWPLSDE